VLRTCRARGRNVDETATTAASASRPIRGRHRHVRQRQRQQEHRGPDYRRGSHLSFFLFFLFFFFLNQKCNPTRRVISGKRKCKKRLHANDGFFTAWMGMCLESPVFRREGKLVFVKRRSRWCQRRGCVCVCVCAHVSTLSRGRLRKNKSDRYDKSPFFFFCACIKHQVRTHPRFVLGYRDILIA
jgi:hypothetical protein